MAVKEIAVFGLGRMGKAIAETFAENGGQVIAIDIDQGKVDDIADKVAYAIRADINDIEDIKALGISNVDVAVVTLAENFETSIMAIIACKEMGIPMVYAKAKDRIKGKILEKVGADKVLYPEEEVGSRIAMTLKYGNLHEYINLEGDFYLIEADVPKRFVGKSLLELNLRKKYGFNVIALKKNSSMITNINVEEPLKEGYQMLVVGHKDKLNKILNSK